MSDTILPTGERLPGYDQADDGPVDAMKLHAWLVEHCNWGGVIGRSPIAVREVLTALQAVSDATLVKNGTYRAMRRDGASVERLAAGLAKRGLHGAVIEANGDPVDAALAVIDAREPRAEG